MQSSALYKFVLASFCLASLIYLAGTGLFIHELVSMGTNPVYDISENILSYASRVLAALTVNPLLTLVVLTTVAIWLRSGMALWIHIAMTITAVTFQARELIFLFAGMVDFRTIAALVFEFVGLCLLVALWRRGELTMRSNP